MSWDLQRIEEGWRLPIEGRAISRCIVDHAFALELHEGGEKAVVRIEGAFTVLDRCGTHQLTPAAPMELGPAVGLFGLEVRSAVASTSGRLEIVFEDGRLLSVEPDASGDPGPPRRAAGSPCAA